MWERFMTVALVLIATPTFCVCVLASTAYSATLSKTKSGAIRLQSTTDIVHPINCGGNGTLEETRVSDCQALPCTLTHSTTIEMDFIPSKDSQTPLLRVTLTPTSTGIAGRREGFLGGDGLEAGVLTTITLGDFGDDITSQELVMEIEILDDEFMAEICISGTFNQGLVHSTPTITTTTTTTATTATSTTTTESAITKPRIKEDDDVSSGIHSPTPPTTLPLILVLLLTLTQLSIHFLHF